MLQRNPGRPGETDPGVTPHWPNPGCFDFMLYFVDVCNLERSLWSGPSGAVAGFSNILYVKIRPTCCALFWSSNTTYLYQKDAHKYLTIQKKPWMCKCWPTQSTPGQLSNHAYWYRKVVQNHLSSPTRATSATAFFCCTRMRVLPGVTCFNWKVCGLLPVLKKDEPETTT